MNNCNLKTNLQKIFSHQTTNKAYMLIKVKIEINTYNKNLLVKIFFSNKLKLL